MSLGRTPGWLSARSSAAGEVFFDGAKFYGGQVDFGQTWDWSHRPAIYLG